MTMPATLELPQLSGGRRRAVALIKAAGVGTDLRQVTVVVDCRQLRAGTESFADELVRTLLVDRGAEKLEATGVSEQFSAYLKAAGETHGVAHRLAVRSSTS